MGKRIAIPFVVVLVALGAVSFVQIVGLPNYDVRDHRLAHPISVATVTDDGNIHLADGRTFRPAGVGFPADPKARDAALQFMRLAVKQGVELRSDPGDGSAWITCEPRFYNWCGTGRVRGWYIPCGLSELLVASGHATIEPTAQLAAHDAERLRVADLLAETNDTRKNPTPTIATGIRCGSVEKDVARIDELIEMDLYSNRP